MYIHSPFENRTQNRSALAVEDSMTLDGNALFTRINQTDST
jgi:hypothetical protein